MNWSKLKLPFLALLMLVLASYVVFLEVQASEESDEQVGFSAVWNPSPGDLAQIQTICGSQAGNYGRCFIDQMGKFGATPDAVNFTETFAEQHQGAIAFLQGFRPLDAVDFGYVFFRAGADFKQRWFLLNGTPAMINVDDFALLPQAEMLNDPAYPALRSRYPHLTLFDGDRSSGAPAEESLADGGQRFSIDYPLKNQCRACAVVGHATFVFTFDAVGRLAEVKFLKITPAAPASIR